MILEAPLLERICSQDQSAMAALYRSRFSQVFGYVSRIVRDHSAAEEVTQDVFFQVWRSAGTYDLKRGAALAWIMNIARSRSLDRLRRDHAFRRLEPLTDFEVSNEPDPESLNDGAMRSAVVRRALDQLPERNRRVLKLAYYLGMTHSEIAAHLGQPLGTIKSQIRTGLLLLGQSLAAGHPN